MSESNEKTWTGEGLREIQVTLGLALPDHTWVEQIVSYEIDPEFEDHSTFDLCQNSFEHLSDEVKNKLAPSGWFLVDWSWVDED